MAHLQKTNEGRFVALYYGSALFKANTWEAHALREASPQGRQVLCMWVRVELLKVQ
jgi:hypothetical protein